MKHIVYKCTFSFKLQKVAIRVSARTSMSIPELLALIFLATFLVVILLLNNDRLVVITRITVHEALSSLTFPLRQCIKEERNEGQQQNI